MEGHNIKLAGVIVVVIGALFGEAVLDLQKSSYMMESNQEKSGNWVV